MSRASLDPSRPEDPLGGLRVWLYGSSETTAAVRGALLDGLRARVEPFDLNSTTDAHAAPADIALVELEYTEGASVAARCRQLWPDLPLVVLGTESPVTAEAAARLAVPILPTELRLTLRRLIAARRGGDVNAAVIDEAGRLCGELNEMVSLLIHDLRSPLTVLKSAASMLDQEVDPDFRREILESCRASVVTFEVMLEDFRTALAADVPSVPSGSRTDLRQLCASVTTELRDLATANDIRLALEPGAPCVAAIGEGAARTILRSALIYAMGGAPQSSEVTVSVGGTAELAEVTIADAGSPPPADLVAKLGEPRAVALLKGSGARVGRGMPLVALQRRLDAAHGNLVLEAAGARGTRMRLQLPLPR